MRNAAHQTRANRTITVDFQNATTYFQLLGDGKAFVECVLAFLLALGFQLAHKATCHGGGVTIWRLHCTACLAGFTVPPPFVLRYRSMRPDRARAAPLA